MKNWLVGFTKQKSGYLDAFGKAFRTSIHFESEDSHSAPQWSVWRQMAYYPHCKLVRTSSSESNPYIMVQEQIGIKIHTNRGRELAWNLLDAIGPSLTRLLHDAFRKLCASSATGSTLFLYSVGESTEQVQIQRKAARISVG